MLITVRAESGQHKTTARIRGSYSHNDFRGNVDLDAGIFTLKQLVANAGRIATATWMELRPLATRSVRSLGSHNESTKHQSKLSAPAYVAKVGR
jgi:hypothetical protein